MMRSGFVLMLACLMPWARLEAKPAGVRATQQSSVSVVSDDHAGGSGEFKIHKINRTYDVLGRGGDGREFLLLEQTIDTEALSESGYTKAEVTLNVSRVANDKRSPLFTIHDKGSRATIWDGGWLFIASEAGCCGSLDTHTVYELDSGKRLLFTGGQGEPYLLGLEDTGGRYYVGVHASGSTRDKDIYGVALKRGERGLLVAVASPASRQDAILIAVARTSHIFPEVVTWSKPGKTSQGGRWNRVEKDQSAVLEIRIDAVKAFQIPLRGGRFDLTAIVLPPQIRLTRVATLPPP